MLNKKNYMLSQYANTPEMLILLEGFEAMLDGKEAIQNFYDKIFNIQTANSYGLNIWGKILNIPRQLKVSIPGEPDIYELPDDLYKLLLLTKAMANISNCTVLNLEEILNNLFKDRGKVYVFDTGIMTMKYVFDFYLSSYEKAILDLPGIPPKPTGVRLSIEELPPNQLFGFNKTGFQPFDQAPFRK